MVMVGVTATVAMVGCGNLVIAIVMVTMVMVIVEGW